MVYIDERREAGRDELVVEPSARIPLVAKDALTFDYAVGRNDRATQKGHAARVIWLTGLSGAGKSTLANRIDVQLMADGVHSYVLDGDSLRAGLSSDLGFTAEDRQENVRRVAEVAHLMYDAGLVVIVALISPFRADRRLARGLFPAGHFLEVYVDTSVEICAQRDPKGLYAKADAGSLSTMTGRGQRYEVPQTPDLIVHGTGDVTVTANEVIAAAFAPRS